MATQPTLGLGAKFGCAEVCELAGTAATSTPASANPPHEVIDFAETFTIPPAPFSLLPIIHWRPGKQQRSRPLGYTGSSRPKGAHPCPIRRKRNGSSVWQRPW